VSNVPLRPSGTGVPAAAINAGLTRLVDCNRIGSEIVVEGNVLAEDHNNVLDVPGRYICNATTRTRLAGHAARTGHEKNQK
jgi:hypothetical protein